jgi:hypothetical protein
MIIILLRDYTNHVKFINNIFNKEIVQSSIILIREELVNDGLTVSTISSVKLNYP